MKRLIPIALLLLLVFAFVPMQAPAHAQGTPKIDVRSTYTLQRYGYALVNESVTMTNNGTSSVQAPSLTFGFGDLSSLIVSFNLTGSGFSGSSGGGMSYTVTGPLIQSGGNSSFLLSALVNGVVSTAKNGSMQVLALSSPSISSEVDRLVNVVTMPSQTQFKVAPAGLKPSLLGSNDTYYSVMKSVTPAAVTSLRVIAQSTVQQLNPLRVFFADRTVSPSSNGTPQVTEQIKFQNLGTTPLAQLYVSILAPPTTKVTVVTVSPNSPVLLNSFKTSVANGYINLANFIVGYPTNGVPVGANYTVTFRYPLGNSYYKISGGQVKMHIPDTTPISAFIDSYTVTMGLPQGARAVQTQTTALSNVTPWQAGVTDLTYSLSLGWGIDIGIPVASITFVALLVGLFAAGTATMAPEEGEEAEESSGELATAMITTFDEKTNLINSLWQEIDSRDLNEFDRAYFDGLRGRLDQFRSRALQRLTEVRQKATNQKFADILAQIQTTEREVDKAAKDKLNLCQQYRLRQMREEVYGRLLPQYSKRLERALNQLSDELHTVQREAKLL